MTQHTPGPWQVLGPRHSDGKWFIKPRPHGDAVASCHIEANARLIAAAPDMATGLGFIADQAELGIAYVKGAHSWGEQVRYLVMKLHHCADTALAAIAKAEEGS